MITIGITVATITTPKPKATAHASERSTKLEFASGISLLTFALFLSAWLGLYQEETYRRHGKQWREGIFYTVREVVRLWLISAFPIPSFLLPLVSDDPLNFRVFPSFPDSVLSGVALRRHAICYSGFAGKRLDPSSVHTRCEPLNSCKRSLRRDSAYSSY
jgi:hypothetical protein